MAIQFQGLIQQTGVQPHTPVIDALIQLPGGKLRRGPGPAGQAVPDVSFHVHVPHVVLTEPLPLVRGVLGVVPGAVLGWLAEVADQLRPLGELLFFQTQGGPHLGQCTGQPQGGRLDHRTAPLLRGHRPDKVPGQTGALKGGVVGGLGNLRVGKQTQKLVQVARREVGGDRRQQRGLPISVVGQVNDPGGLVVHLVANQQYGEVRGLGIGPDPGLLQIDAGIGFYVHSHFHPSALPVCLIVSAAISSRPMSLTGNSTAPPPVSVS